MNKKNNKTVAFTDPRGTKLDDLKKMGYKVETIDLQDLKQSSKFDPLKEKTSEQLKEVKKSIDRIYFND